MKAFLVALFAIISAVHVCADELSNQIVMESLSVETRNGNVYRFKVEMAETREQHATGLMGRQYLGLYEGMLFNFKIEKYVTMWMYNTALSMDMIFVSKEGKVVAIADSTVPFSVKKIKSGVPVLAVLEILGGRAETLGIKEGDRVRHRIFAGDIEQKNYKN